MQLTFPYTAVPIRGAVAPPTLPPGASRRWKPILEIRIVNPVTGRFADLHEAVIDTGAEDTVLPEYFAYRLGLPFIPTSGPPMTLIWRGIRHPLQFARIDFELFDGIVRCRWPAVVSFSPAMIPYPLLGQTGCLEFFNYTGRGSDRVSVLEPIPSFPGTIS